MFKKKKKQLVDRDSITYSRPLILKRRVRERYLLNYRFKIPDLFRYYTAAFYNRRICREKNKKKKKKSNKPEDLEYHVLLVIIISNYSY